MVIDNLKKIIETNKQESPLYVRSLLKEVLQLYILNFIYSSKYGSNFIFTGGTCLRICFDLPRLSEDLDFDVIDIDVFQVTTLEEDIKNYFIKDLQYKDITTKISNNGRTIFLKFPILKDLGLSNNPSESDILMVRIDITERPSNIYKEEVSIKTTPDFSFIINRYSLQDLFATKICAIIQRSFQKGDGTINIKGRDYYDLLWFLEKTITPNFARIGDILKVYSKEEIIKLLNEKVENVNEAYIKEDLAPFLKDQSFVSNYVKRYKEIYKVLFETRVDYSIAARLANAPLYLELNALRNKYPQYERIFFEALNNETLQRPEDMQSFLLLKAKEIGNQDLIFDLKNPH
jgi:predicted nucleotidyltransferase component of viral defense system